MVATLDFKTEKIAELIAENFANGIQRLLVVGCGSGLEAAVLARMLDTNVEG